MISLEGVTKYHWTKAGRRCVLDDVNFTFERGRSVGLLGANGAGKSTLIRLIAGLEKPSAGRIRRQARISWPLGLKGGFHSTLTGAENVRFVSRIYDVDYADIIDFVADFAEIGDYLNMPIKTYSSGMVARLAFGLSFALRFDVYLIDEVTAVGDAGFRERCEAELAGRCQNADVIMVSHSMSTLRQYCNHGVILDNGKLETFETLDASIAEYERRLKHKNG